MVCGVCVGVWVSNAFAAVHISGIIRAQAKAAKALAGGKRGEEEGLDEAEVDGGGDGDGDDGVRESRRGRRTGKGKKSEKGAAAAAGEGKEEEKEEANK